MAQNIVTFQKSFTLNDLAFILRTPDMDIMTDDCHSSDMSSHH